MEHNRVVYSKAYDSEVEYLKSTGAQWIDTGIIPQQGYSAECTFSDAVYGFLFGCRKSISLSPLFCICLGSGNNGTIWFQYGNPLSTGEISNLDVTSMHTVKLGEQCYYDGELVATKGSTWSSTTTLSIYLFAYNQNGSSSDRRGKIKIYLFKIYNQNNNLVRDFIPVRVGNIGYMYDRVSGKLFGNKGTGNFILGPDVANPVPNIRRVFRFGNKRFVMPMPYDSKIEYLESTGTQWINTDTIVNSLDSISVTLQITQPTVPVCIWNARNVSPLKNTISLFRVGNNLLRFDYGKEQVSKHVTGFNFSIKHEYKSVANTLYVDGISKVTNTAASFTAGKSVMVLASCTSNDASTVNNFACAKLYSVKIINSNNETLRDLIPVRRGNVGYLYDKVSGKLFGNSGTGQFILGNDIND